MGEKGFTLLEVMIVIAIIVILVVLGFHLMYPAAVASRNELCIVNLKYIYGAKANFFMDNPSRRDEEPSWGDLVPFYLKKEPSCPSGGEYHIGGIRENPACTVRGHEI